jgi:6,7-dimethyl-8-ribityllumazine synthase
MSMTYHFGIVCAQYNARYTDALLEQTSEHLVGHRLSVLRVPGTWEIPWALAELLRQHTDLHALIALGLVWQGATAHADLISRECARACMDISLRHHIPVIFQVLTVVSEEQAEERVFGHEFNRAREAAEAALKMAALRTGATASGAGDHGL